MKIIKRTIFAALIVAVISIFATRVVSDTTVNDLLDQNIEALAQGGNPNESEDPGEGGGATITCHQTWVGHDWAQCWKNRDPSLLPYAPCEYDGHTWMYCKVL